MISDGMIFERLLQLISEVRLRPSTHGNRGVLIASESDKGRVINSAAFRRLQQKAQVFPLEPNAAVRTRLTHSVEVSQVGRHIAQKVLELQGESDKGTYAKLAAFVNTVETACLLHDIGNPPFGHLGEAAIRQWFRDRSDAPLDMLSFDGNPQGFRIAAFLAGADEHGFNLTCTQLLSIVKYPTQPAHSDTPGEKQGVFNSEWSIYERACERLGWQPGKKFPFAQLMDAADDIAYSTSDLEDGLEKGIVSIDELRQEFGAEGFASSSVEAFVAFKTQFINRAVSAAAEAFLRNLDAVLTGEKVNLLEAAGDVDELLGKIKSFARRRIYSDADAEQVELAGKSAIDGLLRSFGSLLDLPEEEFALLLNDESSGVRQKNLDFHLRLLHRIPTSYRKKYQIGLEDERSRRAHLIADFIAGMTDDFALESFQVLHGIRIL